MLTNEIHNEKFPADDVLTQPTNEIVYALTDTKDMVAYTDQTGRFPFKSSRGFE